MTGGEAASLVLSTLSQEAADGTFVFQMGDPVQIVRLAQAVIDDLASDATIELTELKVGEARHEKLFSDDEEPGETQVERVFRVEVPPLDREIVFEQVGGLEAAVGRSPDEARKVLASLAHWPVDK